MLKIYLSIENNLENILNSLYRIENKTGIEIAKKTFNPKIIDFVLSKKKKLHSIYTV